MSLRLLKAAAAALALCGALAPALAQAQTFERPVRIVVPFAPGGTSDILARLISPKLSEAIGQPVVVENKPGAAGNIGADAVAKARPDGHTLLLMDIGSLAVAPSLFPDLTYDVQKDLAPVGMVMFGPYVMAVHPSVPAKNVAELVAYAKANPGKLAVANSGVGALNHITAVALARGLGIDWKNVPYKGGSAASRAVVSGESTVIINGATATLPFVTNKQLVGIAVTGDARLPALPDVETFKEAKLPLGRCRHLAGPADHRQDAARDGRPPQCRAAEDPGNARHPAEDRRTGRLGAPRHAGRRQVLARHQYRELGRHRPRRRHQDQLTRQSGPARDTSSVRLAGPAVRRLPHRGRGGHLRRDLETRRRHRRQYGPGYMPRAIALVLLGFGLFFTGRGVISAHAGIERVHVRPLLAISVAVGAVRLAGGKPRPRRGFAGDHRRGCLREP